MQRQKHFYLIHIQYLGFRFHGWAKQPKIKTVHLMIDKTLRFVLGDVKFKTMGTSRTDAMVSANNSAFELFIDDPIDDFEGFLSYFNQNLPSDIRALKIEEVSSTFNILNSSKVKHYEYVFAFGEKPHPFGAALMAFISGDLDVELMKKGAAMYVGKHNFGTFCTQPKPNTQFEREVLESEIIENTKYTANFFPKDSFIFKVSSAGFMRNQVRLMMGQLILLGRGEIQLSDLELMLENRLPDPLQFIAPASGLILDEVDFDLDEHRP